MAKYSKAAQKGVKSAIKRMEKETLRSGSTGKKVTNPKQAIAIGLSQAKKKGAKVPVNKKATVPKKTIPKKAIKKNKAVKKAVAKKGIPKKAPIKKATIKKVAAKKVAPKKVVAKKAVIRNITAKKSSRTNPAPVKAFTPLRAVPPQTEQADKIPDTTILPDAKELSEELVEKTASINMPGPEIEEPSGNGLTVAAKIEDPLTSFDKHVFQKATIKGDPHGKLHLSSVNKSSIRPSGKKPLWRK